MVMRGASVEDSEVLTPLYEEDGPPLTLSDLASLDAAEVLDFAEVLPPDGALVDVLLSLRRDRLDQTSQARLARLWARVEAVACGHKLAAVGAIDLAGPEPGDLVDMRDQRSPSR
jgi:hypothetical protein